VGGLPGLIDPAAKDFPFQYEPAEQIELIHYRLPSYPYESDALRQWLRELYRPGQLIGTLDLLNRLNTHIFESLTYAHRDDAGVQLPCDTLVRGSGSCRDFAVLMMEAARHWGFAARFVSGYIQMAEGQHGATHAWTEVYLPGAGWHGFDPTNNKMAGNEHIAVAVAREQEKASPVAGTASPRFRPTRGPRRRCRQPCRGEIGRRGRQQSRPARPRRSSCPRNKGR